MWYNAPAEFAVTCEMNAACFNEGEFVMTIVAMTLFLVPFMALCMYILALGFSDVFNKKKIETASETEPLESK